MSQLDSSTMNAEKMTRNTKSALFTTRPNSNHVLKCDSLCTKQESEISATRQTKM